MHEQESVRGEGPPVNVTIRRTGHCIHVIPANDTKGKRVRTPNFPCRRWGSNPGTLSPDALNTQLQRFLHTSYFETNCVAYATGPGSKHEMPVLTSSLCPVCFFYSLVTEQRSEHQNPRMMFVVKYVL